jgi:MarR family transcriptional regulator, transcriptional regulator for hemolysin
VTRQLILAAKALRAYLEVALAAEGEALSTFIVLDVVARGEGKRQRELADGVRIEGATMTRHLDRLESDGLVARRRDPSDRRAVLVDLTERGRRTYERLRVVVRATRAEAWRGIDDADREVTRRVLSEVARNVERLAAEPSGPTREGAVTHA